MKIIGLILALLFSVSLSLGQSLSVFDVDASNFPTIKAKFFAFDKDGKQITNLNPSDFEVKENGQPRIATYVSCPAPQPPVALSSVLVFDVSGSMKSGPPRIQSAKDAANAWIDGLPLGKSECALVTFDERSYIVQDFTTSRDKLNVAINKLTPDGGTNYNQALIDMPSGGLQIAKSGKYKKVVIFLTDGLPNSEPNTSEIIKFANDNDITIYAVTLEMPAPQSIKDMTLQTGGQYFENITTKKEAEDTYRQLLQTAQGGNPCEIEWESGAICIAGITNVEIGISNLGVTAKASYQSPNTSVAKLDINPTFIKFQDIEIGVKVEKKVTLTARNADFNVTNIKSNNAAFEIIPGSFTLNSGESIELTVSYLPSDSGYVYAQFEIENDICPIKYYASGGISGIKPKIKTLKLLHPNGGEEFIIGSDTIITWEGISKSDTCSLEYSIDNGKNWKLITVNATNFIYNWKNIPQPTSNQCLIRIKQLGEGGNNNLIPKIEWQKSLGGINGDVISSVQETSDYGFIMVGYTNSLDDPETVWKGGHDYWVIKLDVSGKIEWEKTFGGNGVDKATSVQETLDGGFIVAGYSYSSFDSTVKWKSDGDYLLIKLDKDGNKQWQKTLGGSETELAYSVNQTTDGGYIVAGEARSNDGDITNSKGHSDFWIVKLDDKGNFQWQKSLGGSKADIAYSIDPVSSGGYIVAGFTESTNGDVKKKKNNFYDDYWIVKLDETCNILWQTLMGGSNSDRARSIKETIDRGFILVGDTYSIDGDIKENKGNSDFWIVKLDSSGNLQYQKTLGGSEDDYTQSINQTTDGGYIVSGSTKSIDGDITENKGIQDYWIVKLSETCNLQWQKSLGGKGREQAFSIQQTYDNGYIVVGYTTSNDGDVTENHGGSDGWIIKLTGEGFALQEDESDSVFSIVAPQASATDIDMKQCLIGTTKDSVVVDFVKNTGSWKFRVDSIYFQGADADAFSLVSGFPKYVVEANQVHHAEFRFIPNRVGIHSAEIVIITQAEKLTQIIRGEGVAPRLELVTDLIDFGTVDILNYKDTMQVATIKNIGIAPILITNTKHNYPNDIDFTTLSGGGSFTLQPNDTHKMDLRFTPSSIGRTSGTLEFHYDGVGSPAIIQLYGQGLGGLIIIDSDSAYAGEKRILRLRLGNNIKPKSDDLATGFKARISYNPTLLSCQDVNVTKNYSLLAETIEINGKWDGKSDLLGEFEVIAGLGNADSTYLVLEEFNWLDDNEQPIDYEVETQNGTFKLLGICYEGGVRLINPNNKVELLQISPNPNDGNLAVELNLIEEGFSTLSIYNSNGQLMYEQNITGSTGKIDLNIDTKEYGNGLYFVSLQTPTIRKVKQMVVFK